MRVAIITHVPHLPYNDTYAGYGPYVREMNLWGKYASSFEIVAPIAKGEMNKIDLLYDHNDIRVFQVPSMAFTSFGKGLKTLINLPVILFQLWRVMRRVDHIHLRCPGTLGLMGCFVQMLFPSKPKTAKYAGNWDPKAEQPFSYRLQKKLLSNTFFTRNMKVLVYGEWPNQTKNILPFFTATYPKSKIGGTITRTYAQPYRFMFVGTLSPGKQPNYVLQMIQELKNKGISVRLDIYGDGIERNVLEEYVKKNSLSEEVTFHGNQTSDVVEKAYKTSHFMMLPSKSEGWPKVIAEAMFWGCIPIATKISCVSWMLGNGERGVLLGNDHKDNIERLQYLLRNEEQLSNMSLAGQKWSHRYTLDHFESEIKKLLQ